MLPGELLLQTWFSTRSPPEMVPSISSRTASQAPPPIWVGGGAGRSSPRSPQEGGRLRRLRQEALRGAMWLLRRPGPLLAAPARRPVARQLSKSHSSALQEVSANRLRPAAAAAAGRRTRIARAFLALVAAPKEAQRRRCLTELGCLCCFPLQTTRLPFEAPKKEP